MAANPPMGAVALGYAALPAELSYQETADGLRIYVPFRLRERAWLVAWILPLWAAVPVLTVWAALDAMGVLGTGIAVAILIGFGTLWAAVGLAAALVLWFTRGTVVEYDGRHLRVRGYVSRRGAREWPREKVRQVSVRAMPIVPLANLLIHVGYDAPVRAGCYRPAELEEAARRLRIAMGLDSGPALPTP